MFSKVTLFTLSCLIFSSCFSNKNESLSVSFSGDSTSIVIKGVDEVSRFQLIKLLEGGLVDSLDVVRVSAKSDGRKIEGKVAIVNNDVVFTPSERFSSGEVYQVSTLLNSSFGSTKDILKGKIGSTIKRTHLELER